MAGSQKVFKLDWSRPDGKRRSGADAQALDDEVVAANIVGVQLCRTDDDEGVDGLARDSRAPKVARELGGGSGIRGRSGVRRAVARGQMQRPRAAKVQEEW